MTDEATIDFAKESDALSKFKDLLKYRNGEPRPIPVVVLCSTIIGVVWIIGLMAGKASHEKIYSDTSVFTVPALKPPQSIIELPEFNRNATLKSLASQNPGTGKPVKLLGPQLLKRPQAANIPPGSMAKAELLSGASNGLVKAELKEPVVINGERLVDAGTVAIGNGTSTDNRLYIKFNKLVYRDGTTESINAEAADESDKTVGLKGSKIGYHALRLGAGIGLNFVGGMAAGLQDTQGQFGATITKPTMKNALLNGAATASLDESRDMMESLKNDPPVIEIPPSQIFYLLFNANGE